MRKTKKVFSVEELFCIKKELQENMVKEISICHTLDSIFNPSKNSPIFEETPIRIKNAISLIKEIYSKSIKYVNVDGLNCPFVSELGIIKDGEELYIDKKSIEALEKILKVAKPYCGLIKSKFTNNKVYEEHPLLKEYYCLGGELFNQPEDFVPLIEYQNGVFILSAKPDFEFGPPSHTHIFDLNQPPAKLEYLIFPSFGDLEFQEEDSKGLPMNYREVDIIYTPLDFRNLNKNQICDYIKHINTNVVIGSRTQMDKIKKEIRINLLTI